MRRCSRVFVGMVHGTRCEAMRGPVPEVPDPISSATPKFCRAKPRPRAVSTTRSGGTPDHRRGQREDRLIGSTGPTWPDQGRENRSGRVDRHPPPTENRRPEDARPWMRSMARRHEMQIEKSPSLAERPVPEFPGCRPITIRRGEIATHEGRFEFWDADTETAWVMRDPTGFAHEGPSQRLAGLAQLIAAGRGAPIECCGTMDLTLRDARGERWGTSAPGSATGCATRGWRGCGRRATGCRCRRGGGGRRRTARGTPRGRRGGRACRSSRGWQSP